MKYIRFSVFIFSVTTLIFFSACNDPTVIGSDLLSDDQLDINFTDTVTIHSYNLQVDSVRTFNPESASTNSEHFPLGVFEDHIFGTSFSGLYIEPTINFSFPDFDSTGNVLDSVVLVLPFNAKGSYGNLDETYSLEVYQLNESFPDTQLYSNMEFAADRLIGTFDYVPAVNDSVVLDVPGTVDSTTKVAPQIRIPLDNDFATELFELDTPYSSNVNDFEEYLKGIYIKPVSANGGMPSFTLRGSNAGIQVYYHLDTVHTLYLFPIFSTNVVTANFKHDYSTSTIGMEDYLGNDAIIPDSLLFVQGMSGINFVIEVPHAEALSEKVLNKAELIFPIQYLPGDDETIYTPVDQILVSEILEDESVQLIDDFIFATNREGVDGFSNLFGGNKESDNTYRVNITTHLQDMSRGLVTEKMLITLFLKSEQASRVVLGGTKNSINKAKLELTFTNF